MFRIEVSSSFDQLWRYNILMSCAGITTVGDVLYVESAELVTSEEFQSELVKLPPPPVGFDPTEPLVLECRAAEKLRILIYVIAHMLPEDRWVENSPPFDLDVEVWRANGSIYKKSHKVNQWGGASITIEL